MKRANIYKLKQLHQNERSSDADPKKPHLKVYIHHRQNKQKDVITESDCAINVVLKCMTAISINTRQILKKGIIFNKQTLKDV